MWHLFSVIDSVYTISVAQHNIIGKSGEDIVAAYLQEKNYNIVERNFKTKVGEIDIVAKEKSQIVFVEVKTRSTNLFGTPSEAITHKKLHSLIRAGEYYLLAHNLSQNYRIDAVEVLMHNGKVQSLNHIKNITL